MTETVADLSAMSRSRGRRLDETDRLLVWIRSLVRDLERLEQRGAPEAELERSRGEIAKLLWRLAATVKRGADRGEAGA